MRYSCNTEEYHGHQKRLNLCDNTKNVTENAVNWAMEGLFETYQET